MLPFVVYVRRKIFGHYSGLSWFIFIWINRSVEDREQLMNHEKIHFRQQVELLFIIHWILYAWYYLFFRLQGHGHHHAYLNNPFEREAYENEHNTEYLVNRPRFAWRRYGKSSRAKKCQK